MPKYRESDADIDFYNKFKIEEKILQAEKLLLKVQEILRQKPDLFEIAESSLNHLINDLEQRENSLELKRIEELTNKHFFVDSYQRGYKWKPQQVKALLDDIDELRRITLEMINNKVTKSDYAKQFNISELSLVKRLQKIDMIYSDISFEITNYHLKSWCLENKQKMIEIGKNFKEMAEHFNINKNTLSKC